MPRIARNLGVREAEEKLERQHLPLLGRQPLDERQHPGLPDRVHRLLLRRGFLELGKLRQLVLRLHSPTSAEVVHREVVRDPKQPRGERDRLPAEPADRLEHLQERLRREVLGVVPVADAEVQIAVDAIEVEQVELLERAAVAALGTLHESPDL